MRISGALSFERLRSRPALPDEILSEGHRTKAFAPRPAVSCRPDRIADSAAGNGEVVLLNPRKADSPLGRAHGPIDSAQVCGQGRTSLRCGVGQARTVFEQASYGSPSVSLSESGFYGSRVSWDSNRRPLGMHQGVTALIMRRKLLILREVVGAKGFEPSTSWSRRLLARRISRLAVAS
jgi:hypothetical protein